MPKLTSVDTKAARNLLKPRRVKLPKAPVIIKPVGLSGPSGDGYTVLDNGLIMPSRDDMRAFGNVIFAPTPTETAQFGDAEHTAYQTTHEHHYSDPDDTLSWEHVETGSDQPTINPVITAEHPPVANTTAATPAVRIDTDRMLARRAAAKAVREFYAGVSMPFKAAVDLQYRAAINFARFVPGTITGTERTAAAIAAVLAYCDVSPDGTFIRGSGNVPRRLLGLTERPDEMLRAGLESGVLSRLIGTGAVSYVSGATHGKSADDATYRVNYNVARTNMLAHNEKQAGGEHRFSRPLALLDATITDHA